MLSWDHPRERPLPRWIDDVGLYPITILKSVNSNKLQNFSGANIMLLQDLVKMPPENLEKSLSLSKDIVKKLVDEAKMVLIK